MLGQTVTQPQTCLAKGLLWISTLILAPQSPLRTGILTYELDSGQSNGAVVTVTGGMVWRSDWSVGHRKMLAHQDSLCFL